MSYRIVVFTVDLASAGDSLFLWTYTTPLSCYTALDTFHNDVKQYSFVLFVNTTMPGEWRFVAKDGQVASSKQSVNVYRRYGLFA